MKLIEILGSELFNKLSDDKKEKYKNADLKDISGGEYVSKESLDNANEKIKDYKQKLGEQTELINKLNKLDPEKLSEEVKTLKGTLKKQQDDFEKQLQQKDFDFALNSKLGDFNCQNKKVVASLLDKEKLALVNGEVIGLKEQIDALKQSDSYLFKSEQTETQVVKINTGSFDTNTGNPNKPGQETDGLEGMFERLGKEQAEKIKNLGI